MMELVYALLVPVLVTVVTIFLSYRLAFFSDKDISGRYAFLNGAGLVLAASIWQVLTHLTGYHEWFVESAYPFIQLVQLLVLVGGVLLVTTGLALYADSWQTRREELSGRDRQLTILDSLQTVSHSPYQLIEFLEISLKEVVSRIPQTAGAVFLVNRVRRQIVLTATVGLSRNETASLEHYPLGQNIITQAIEIAEPLISDLFEFVDPSGKKTESRFRSCLVLPLVSGNERIGGMVLFAEDKGFFDRSEIRCLSPVAEWLAEKVNSARLSRDLVTIRNELQASSDKSELFAKHITEAAGAFVGGEPISAFSKSLVGLAGSQSAHLYGLKNGTLRFHGGSDRLWDLSENYRTALIEALDRSKPLIINQEGQGAEGRSYIVRSTLIYPIPNSNPQDALLLVKDSSAFKVSDEDLALLAIYGRLAGAMLRQVDMNRLDITRRKGLDTILQLLRLDPKNTFSSNPVFFLEHLSTMLPEGTVGIAFSKGADQSFSGVAGLNIDDTLVRSVRILPGDGAIGRALPSSDTRVIFGRNRVIDFLNSFHEADRETLVQAFGEQGLPNFIAISPVTQVDAVVGAIILCLFNISESDKGEWQRLFMLAGGLYSVRLTIGELSRTPFPVSEITDEEADKVGQTLNQLNNHLSAIIGNAELATVRGDLSGDAKVHFRSIIQEAEAAAGFLRSRLGLLAAPAAGGAGGAEKGTDISSVIASTLGRSRISENLFMVGGRPREINRSFGSTDRVEFSSQAIADLFEHALDRFGAMIADEDVMTVATYSRGEYVYLDISCHHRNFPAVRPVAEFGNYQFADDVFKFRPSDTFLEHIKDKTSYYSYDMTSPQPSYLSFKFPIRENRSTAVHGQAAKARILAVDDQAIILDLLSAMCQTAGYSVKTAQTAQEGLELALNGQFDIILTDLAMPGMSGLEMAREIRKKKPNLPIVLITGWEVNLSPAQLDAAGITNVLYKPFRIEQLTDIIASLAAAR